MSAPQEVICLLGRFETLPTRGKVVWVLDQEEGDLPAPAFVRKIVLETPLQRPIIAKEIAWSTVLDTLSCHAAPGWEEMQQQVEECHLAAHLLLSEVSDFGVGAFARARENWRAHAPFRNFYALQGRFAKIPALICGAGSSLEEAIPFLKKRAEGAFLLAAGSAFSFLDQVGITPDAVCALDQQMIPPSSISSLPLFMQSRLNPEVVSRFRGEKILVPESGPLHWEQWGWDHEQEVPSCGWTVGNFALRIALSLGCDPIILTGMDYCYREGRKYALDREVEQRGGLLCVKNRLGEEVFTQRDWLMAARFSGEILSENLERRVISSAVHGLFLGDQIEVMPFSQIPQFERKTMELEKILACTPYVALRSKGQEWEEEESFYERVLKPLWNIWRPLFAAEGQNLELHQKLFFERVAMTYRDFSERYVTTGE